MIYLIEIDDANVSKFDLKIGLKVNDLIPDYILIIK